MSNPMWAPLVRDGYRIREQHFVYDYGRVREKQGLSYIIRRHGRCSLLAKGYE